MTQAAGAEQFLLDTNAVIALMKGVPHFVEQIKKHEPSAFCITSITLHELYFGACKSVRRTENLARIRLLNFQVLEFDEQDALFAGEARASLAAAGTPIGPLDTLIAGVALARGLTLITHNTPEFKRVAGLRVNDWE
jgi:tRNA(fMet)-specific endonuclease VapC